MFEIGITERGDAALDTAWWDWVKQGKPAILITKDPEKLTHVLCELSERDFGKEDWWMTTSDTLTDMRRFDRQGYDERMKKPVPRIIIHCTITGYGGSVLEPNVPTLDSSLGYYKHFVEYLGACRTVLRIDPIIPTEMGLQIALNVYRASREIPPYNHIEERIRVSFMDNYSHVEERLTKIGMALPYHSIHAPLEDRLRYLARFIKGVDECKRAKSEITHVEVCGEPGILCTGCVSERDIEVLGLDKGEVDVVASHKQRKECPCIGAKHELLSEKKRCPHKCAYCYWQG